MSKFTKTNKKIEKTVVSGYKNIEKGVVGGYKAVEETVVNSYKKIENKFIEAFIAPDGNISGEESGTDIKSRIPERGKGDE